MSDPVTVEKYAMGQSVHRLEDPHLLQGLGRYSDDVNLPRQVYAVVVRSVPPAGVVTLRNSGSS